MRRYTDAGVDVAASDRFTALIADRVRSTWGMGVVGGFGGFAAGVTIPPGYDEPVIMMTTDGVGTKLDIAGTLGKLDGVGQDLVAMCVDDLAALGADPLGFTDYLAVGRLDPPRDQAIVTSIATACSAAGCALLGGETAVHPGVMEPDQFDLAGAAIGVVERTAVPTPSSVAAGDVIIGVASPNVRSNGFSLIRAIFEDYSQPAPGQDGSLGDVLLEPSVLYAPAIVEITRQIGVHGLAHITGGGIPGNVPRALPTRLAATIDTGAWDPPVIFETIARVGDVGRSEMFSTFNMGIGFVLITDPADAQQVIELLAEYEHAAWSIGEVVPGDGVILG